jgi:NAD-dependent deacetylase
MLPEQEMQKAWRAAEHCDVFLVIGTSGVVYPAAQLPAIAHRRGGAIIEINTERSALSALAEVLLLGPSGEVLPKLLDALPRTSL